MRSVVTSGDSQGTRRWMLFIGIDTAGSLAAKSFSAWMKVFDADCELVCLNLPRDAADADYLSLLARMRGTSGCVGMQVTNHKVRLYSAARLSFDQCSADVQTLEEVGGVVVSGRRLMAVSPDAAAFRGELIQHLSRGLAAVDIVLLGGGGAARAVVLVASALPNVRRIAVTELDPRRRCDLQRWVDRVEAHGVPDRIQVRSADANDELASTAAEGSVIVNSSGMGKDVPGSPLSGAVTFPRRAVVWDLNYRGELAFLGQAQAQAQSRELHVVDGFGLFIRNWTWLLESVLDKKLDDQTKETLWQTTRSMQNRA